MTTTPLPFERDDSGVVTLTLEQGDRPVIVLDHDLLRRLDAALDAIGDPAGFVLASASDRVFVAGANLHEIDALSDDDLHEYLAFGQRVFGKIAALPCRTVAAVNGAALGGGLELAMHCDVLVGLLPAEGAKPYMVGLPEAGLGLCPGWGGTNLLPARMDPETAIRLTAEGAPLKAHDAVEAGLFSDTADDKAALLELARKLAAAPKTRPISPHCISDPDASARVRSALASVRDRLPNTPASAAVVEAVETGLDQGWPAALRVERERLVELRKTPEARAALAAFFERGKK